MSLLNFALPTLSAIPIPNLYQSSPRVSVLLEKMPAGEVWSKFEGLFSRSKLERDESFFSVCLDKTR